MKIDSYSVNTSSQRSYEEASLTVVKTAQTVSATSAQTTVTSSAKVLQTIETLDTLTLSQRVQEEMQLKKDNSFKGEDTLKSILTYSPSNAYRSKYSGNPLDAKIQMLEAMIRALTGKRYTFSNVVSAGRWEAQQAGSLQSGGTFNLTATTINLSLEQYQYESESVSYTAQGIINTADGKQISVNVNLSMSREYAAYSGIELNATMRNVCDPLVINYSGTAASLTGEKFSFDLDMDGSLDQISFVGEGSGFLALDKNGDGVINDGSELFGPQSGSGFAELRKYDQDGNGWIDENDEVFGSLLIWSKDKDGNDQLFYLKDLDIGAIYLGDTATEFSINNSSNETLGVMRSTSFYLTESGGAGTISHIDLAL